MPRNNKWLGDEKNSLMAYWRWEEFIDGLLQQRYNFIANALEFSYISFALFIFFFSPLQYEARPGWFYLLPKIHKGTLPLPGRPIVSAIKSPTERISQFLDHFLQPCFPRIKSYVKDTGHFIFLLEEIGALPGPTLLATFDVTSLYTNVPLEEARRAVGRSLLRSRHFGDVPHTESLLHLLKLVFTKTFPPFQMVKICRFIYKRMGSAWAQNVPSQ